MSLTTVSVTFTCALQATQMIVDYKWTMMRWPQLSEGTAEDAASLAYRARLSACHQRGAERVLSLCRRNGGVFIKVYTSICGLIVLRSLFIAGWTAYRVSTGITTIMLTLIHTLVSF